MHEKEFAELGLCPRSRSPGRRIHGLFRNSKDHVCGDSSFAASAVVSPRLGRDGDHEKPSFISPRSNDKKVARAVEML